MNKITFYPEDSLFKWLKELSKRTGKSVNKIVLRSMELSKKKEEIRSLMLSKRKLKIKSKKIIKRGNKK